MKIRKGRVTAHEPLSGGYRCLRIEERWIAEQARPGQFVHLRLPRGGGLSLRRPFSLFEADAGRIAILYKVVGRGTEQLTAVAPGDVLDLLGPLGNGFPAPSGEADTVFVAGGYGVAPLYMLARAAPRPGMLFVGGRRAEDILCVDAFSGLGWQVVTATEDGSMGASGLVTAPLDAWLARRGAGDPPAEFFVCGPDGLLRAVADRARARGDSAWLSLDRHMGCGVGACLACVQRVRGPDGRETWARVCRDGPVFAAETVVWDRPGAGESGDA